MIYLDNAATTWPKPDVVKQAVWRAMERYGANPGRGGHRMAMETAEEIYACRETAAELFGLDDPTRVIFTSNCTMALNIVLKGILGKGGHAVISDLEHNSVIRPLEALADKGVTYSTAVVVDNAPDKTVENFRRCIRPDTRLILCTHASNVFGTILPIRQIGKLAHRFGVPFAVDAAQSAGILPLHMKLDDIDYLCMPGHKGLYGPMGTGMLLCRNERSLDTLIEGGTGSVSLLKQQPEDLPDRFESGTINVPGICGLHAGMRWLCQKGIAVIAKHETVVMRYFCAMMRNNSAVQLYTPVSTMGQTTVPLLSVNLGNCRSEEVAAWLSEEGIAVRAGLHCAPLAHTHADTLSSGTVRLSPSAFTTMQEMETVCKKLSKISRKT